MTIGDIIRKKRKELDMNQEDLARIVGTTKATVSRWESGDIGKMKGKYITALSNVLQIDKMIFFQRQEVLLPDEADIIDAYRKAEDGIRASVKKLLDVKERK